MLPWVDAASGLKYEGCQTNGKGAWCPTQVNLTGFFHEGVHSWDFCGHNCIDSVGTSTDINAGIFPLHLVTNLYIESTAVVNI